MFLSLQINPCILRSIVCIPLNLPIKSLVRDYVWPPYMWTGVLILRKIVFFALMLFYLYMSIFSMSSTTINFNFFTFFFFLFRKYKICANISLLPFRLRLLPCKFLYFSSSFTSIFLLPLYYIYLYSCFFTLYIANSFVISSNYFIFLMTSEVTFAYFNLLR